MILKLNPDECEIMNYLKNFIEEREYNNDKNNKKAYIFIVHLKRIYNNSEINSQLQAKYEIPETITFLNEDYYQIFIDDLNGIDINITKIMEINNKRELIKICLPKIDLILSQNIYKIFSYFRYTFKFQIQNSDIDKNNYSGKIIEYIKDNKYLKDKIKNELLNINLIGEEDIIKELFINDHIKQNNIDYMSVISDYLLNNIVQYLSQFIFKSETKYILSPFLSHVNDKDQSFFKNTFISKTIDNALKDINNGPEIKFINQIGCNYITILLGIKIPGIKLIIDDIIAFINEKQVEDMKLSEKYLNNENEIRITSNDGDNEEYMKEINKINRKLKNNELIFYEYLKSISLFKEISEISENEKNIQEEAIKYLDYFFDDYLLIFLSNNFDLSQTEVYNYDLISNFIKIIKYILKIRLDDYDANIKADELLFKIAKKILWIESNTKYIILILMIYQKLTFIQLLNDKIKTIIDNHEITYEFGTERSPSETKRVNECFFLLLESMIKIILNETNLYNKIIKINSNIYNFVNTIKEICHYASQIDYELSLFSKELSNIKSFIEIEEIFHDLNIDKEENIKELIELLIKKNKLNKINDDSKKEDIEILFNSLKNIYDYLQSKIGFHKNYSKLINNFFYGEIKRIKDNNYRQMIYELLLGNKDIIKDSIEIFIVAFSEIIADNSIDALDTADDKFNEYNMNFEIIENTLKKNNDNKIITEQVILNLFESYFSAFFEFIKKLDEDELKIYYKNYCTSLEENRPNDTFIMLDFSLKILKEKLLNLERIYYKEISKDKNEIINENIKYINISKLYSIAYVKIYLFKAIHYILTQRQEFMYFEEEVMRVLNGESLNDFRKILKIYIFKLLNNSLNNYQELQDFHYHDYGFKFIDDFKEELLEKNNEILNYYILPKNEKIIKYEECLKEMNNAINEKFTCNTESFNQFIREENIDIFFSVSSNKILSIKDSKEQVYSKFSSFIKNLLNTCNSLSDYFRNVLFLLLNEHQFNSLIRPLILLNKEENNVLIDYHIYEILLYSMRFCIQTLYNKNHNNLYSQLINEKCTDKINKLYLPGIDESIDKKINNYYLLKEHLNNKSSDYGAYICSCGTYYEIPPCGFPIESYNCINCKKLIGGQEKKKEEKGYHKMIIREGHFRIFKNIEEKNKEFDRFKDTDELIPNMLLSEYKEKIIEPLLKKQPHGISKIDKITFIQKNKKIRNLSQVGYRLLNFILYSHLFFSERLGFINDEFKKQYLYENMTYIEIIKTNWELLKDALFNKGINVIQIFLNLIFDKISNLLKNCPEINTLEQRITFEDSIEKVLEESYKEYEEYSKSYLELNSKLHETNKEKLKSIILELYDPYEYPEDKFPFLKYFVYTEYPTEEQFINELYKVSNYDNLYPLITSYIDPKNDKIELLKCLPKYNKFVNMMINKYSYKISRNEAYGKKLNEEDIYKNNENNFRQTFDDFIDVWNKIRKYCTQYKCHNMDEEILHERMPLCQFLIDDGEIGKGMYLASGYQNFIEWQNQFYRNIYYKNNDDIKINYLNYNYFIYDFNTIEEELGKILLTGKRLFNTNNLKFVTYCYEIFRGEKSSTLIDFIELYPPKELNQEEKKDLIDYIIEKNTYNSYDFTQFMFSLQLIIYYLTQEKKPADSKVIDVINSLPDYLNISDDCKNFFEKFYKFSIEQLFETFSLIELFCFDIISKNLKNDFKIDLEKDKVEKINNYFKNGVQKLIEKIHLASACRKLISRYLVSKRNDNEINPDNLLSLYLVKTDLWNLEIIKNDDLFEMELNNIKDFNIKVSQAYKLCLLLDPDNSLLKEIIIKIEKKKKKKKKEDKKEDKKKIGKKKKLKF